MILDGFKKNNIIDFYHKNEFHYFVKNNCTNKYNHIIGRDFRLSSDLINLVCKIINGKINYNNSWFLLPEDFYITVFNRVVEINYNKFIIRLLNIIEIGELEFNIDIYVLDRIHTYKIISRDDFILYKDNNISDIKIKLD